VKVARGVDSIDSIDFIDISSSIIDFGIPA